MSTDILPLEILQKVLSYLGPEDLSVCCRVSRKWRTAVNYDPIWKRILRLYSVFPEFVTLPPVSKSTLSYECHSKKIVTQFLGRVRSGWRNQECTTHESTKAGAIIDRSACDGKTLVISYINGYIEVYDLITLNLIQTIDITLSGHEAVSVATDTSYVVMAKSNISYIYEKIDGCYVETGIIAVVDGQFKWKDISSVEAAYRRGGAASSFISGGVFWLIDRLRGDVTLVELSSHKVLDGPNIGMADDWLFLGGNVCARLSKELLVFSPKGPVKFRLTRDRVVQIRHADASPTIIAAVLILMDDRNMWKEVTIWDSGNGQYLQSFSVLEDCVVRASLSHVAVVRFGYKDCSVSVHSIYNKNALFRRTFQYSNSSTVHDAKGSFYPITNRYIIALPSGKGQCMMYLESGESFGNESNFFINKFNHFFNHVVVSYSCTIDGVYLLIRSYA